jgi:hypothetical protein
VRFQVVEVLMIRHAIFVLGLEVEITFHRNQPGAKVIIQLEVEGKDLNRTVL